MWIQFQLQYSPWYKMWANLKCEPTATPISNLSVWHSVSHTVSFHLMHFNLVWQVHFHRVIFSLGYYYLLLLLLLFICWKRQKTHTQHNIYITIDHAEWLIQIKWNHKFVLIDLASCYLFFFFCFVSLFVSRWTHVQFCRSSAISITASWWASWIIGSNSWCIWIWICSAKQPK